MAGLYDEPVGALDPRSMAIMQMGLGLMGQGPSPTPISLGQSLGRAGMQGLQAFQQANQANQQNQLMAMKMAEAKKAEEAATQQAAARARLAQDPRFAQFAPLMEAGVPPQAFIEQVFPKTPSPQLVEVPTDKPGVTQKKWVVPGQVDGPAIGGLKQPEILNPDVQAAKRGIAAAGKTDVVVQPDGLGLKPKDRFDMEGKLRDDFRGNPVVKASDEMNSAFKLIETARSKPSPANDLAMATKYMKILDPGSVVRESELALAMGAGGLMDKVQNYANMVFTGKKLTPSQREDFYSSAKAINDSFQKERDGVAERFKQNATQYNLTPENVVGAPRQAAKPAKQPQVEDWVSRAMKANMVSRAVAIKEGKRLGKVPADYED
jgi:hypothetical protein